MVKILLTSDQTLMSEYNKNIFIGFTGCAPMVLPGWLYTKIFCPPVEEESDNTVRYGHCGQRKIEAALLEEGFSKQDVAVVNPDKIKNAVDNETKVLCITTHDPLGLGPASTTFSDLSGRGSFTGYYFNKLITDPTIRKYGLKVIIGGSGAWQLTDERIMAKLGIDCVVVGEGEKTGVEIIKKALNDESLPLFTNGEVVPLDEIPLIHKPTLNGIIEIARGCGRGCGFCNPTMLNYRCIPLEKIMVEAKLNVSAGNGLVLHAEDVLRYKAKGLVPNQDEIIKLFQSIQTITHDIAISHFAHASVVSQPSVIESISEIMQVGSKKYPFYSGQVGVETGSPKIIKKYMKGKVKPFSPRQWPETVIQSHKILNDNKWVPAETLIVGLPDETPEDTLKTIELIDDLSMYKSLIVPLFFVPLGNLNGNGFFRARNATPEQWQLISTCMKHNFRWVSDIIHDGFSTMKINPMKKWAIRMIIYYMDKKFSPYIKLMDGGLNPFQYDRE